MEDYFDAPDKELLQLIGALVSETDMTEDALCDLMSTVIEILQDEPPNIGIAINALREIHAVTRASQSRRRQRWESFSRRRRDTSRVM